MGNSLRINTGNSDRSVIFNIQLGSRFNNNFFNNSSTWTNNFTDFLNWYADKYNLWCILRDRAPRLVNSSGHDFQNLYSSLSCLLECSLQNRQSQSRSFNV